MLEITVTEKRLIGSAVSCAADWNAARSRESLPRRPPSRVPKWKRSGWMPPALRKALGVRGGGGCSGVREVGPTFLGKKPLFIPEPRQRVRLRAGRGPWRGNFRAVSYPYTDEAGEVVIRVAPEGEYQDALREGRSAIGMPWPVRQVEVASLPEDDIKTQELPQSAAEGAGSGEARPGGVEAQEGAERRSWWREFFGFD
jgi:hypothetical protein